MKKWLKWLAAILLIPPLLALIYYWPLINQLVRFSPIVAEADFPKPANKKEAQTQDLNYLATIVDYDRSFSDSGKTAFLRRIDTLNGSSEILSDPAFFMETHALMAMADNAHTTSDFVPAFRQFNRVGLDFYIFEDGLHVVRAHKSLKKLLGSKLISIRGRDPSALLQALERYGGGPKARRDLQSLYYLRSPELLHAAGLAERPDMLTVELQSEVGSIETHQLTALPSAAETEFSYRHPFLSLSPEPLSDEAGDWVRALNSETNEPPLTLVDPYRATMSKQLEGGIYIRSNYLMESPESPVKEQLLAALKDAPPDGFEFLALDLRWNPGGRFSNAIPLAKQAGNALSKTGKVYVIVGPQTFSAAIVAAALFKQYLPDRTLIIGEPMGDRPQFWAERGTSFVLPNSGYHISYATGYHDWENGCDDTIEHCFPPNQREAANIGTLKVDHIIRPTFNQYAKGQDPVLDWILEQ